MLDNKHAVPMRTDRLAMYTGTCPWRVAQKLEFSYCDHMLAAYPDVLLLLIAVLPPKGMSECGCKFSLSCGSLKYIVNPQT